VGTYAIGVARGRWNQEALILPAFIAVRCEATRVGQSVCVRRRRSAVNLKSRH
jgi:hypothetical protein